MHSATRSERYAFTGKRIDIPMRLPMHVAIHVHEDAMLVVASPLEPAEMLVLFTCASALRCAGGRDWR